MSNDTTEFQRRVEGFLSTSGVKGATWSEDRTTIHFPKSTRSGFDITLRFSAPDRMVFVSTDCGYHDHVHLEDYDDLASYLNSLLGRVRAMLSSEMRILEVCNGGKARKWELQALRNGSWVTESSTGLLVWNFFGKKTHRAYSNDTLPPRALDA